MKKTSNSGHGKGKNKRQVSFNFNQKAPGTAKPPNGKIIKYPQRQSAEVDSPDNSFVTDLHQPAPAVYKPSIPNQRGARNPSLENQYKELSSAYSKYMKKEDKILNINSNVGSLMSFDSGHDKSRDHSRKSKSQDKSRESPGVQRNLEPMVIALD